MQDKPLPLAVFAFAQGKDTHAPLAHLEAEKEKITAALQDPEQKGWIEIKIIENTSIDDIFDTFSKPENKDRVVIFHYAGHGETDHLVLESASGGNVSAHFDGLTNLFNNQKNLQLLFLNGCKTNRDALALMEEEIKNVIVTNHTIDDKVAVTFAERFYISLANRNSVREAYEEATNRVKTAGFARLYRSDERGGRFPTDTQTTSKFPWDLLTDYDDGEWKLTDLVPINVFIAHHENDKAAINELSAHMVMLVRRGLITNIRTDSLDPGTPDFEKELIRLAKQAPIILVAISPSLFSGATSYKLVKQALKRLNDERDKVTVIPILLREVHLDNDDVLNRIVGLPRNGRFIYNEWLNKEGKDAAYTHIVRELSPVIDDVRKRLGL